MNNLLVILGPTAIGKTKLAVHLAAKRDGEIISADSRQVYRNMDIGTGKDLADYFYQNELIKSHLIDIVEAGTHYDVFQYQQDFYQVFNEIKSRNKLPILCGGSGMYLQAALNKQGLLPVEKNKELREQLRDYSQEDLLQKLKQLNPKLHNETDSLDRQRTIRAIEIAHAQNEQAVLPQSPVENYIIIGLYLDRELLRERIKDRMISRFKAGMIAEVESLIKSGVDLETLRYYGLEYRWIADYLSGLIDLQSMEEKLLQGIRRFAKKQMTWFRRMEKQGFNINWINASLSIEKQLEESEKIIDGKL